MADRKSDQRPSGPAGLVGQTGKPVMHLVRNPGLGGSTPRDGAGSAPDKRGSGDRLSGRTMTRLARLPWPLLAVLVFQAAASLRLVWSNTAFQDEALYLWAGHLELAHWLHGTSIPAFAAFTSGSPVLYPPLGALADSLGGLAAARILSLGFMLAATSLLWATASRLYGRRAAFFACGSFAVLGPALRLGAFATYDPMSLGLLALAAWCAVRAGEQQKSYGWLAGASLALALANATKYASALFDPVVIGLLVLTAAKLLTRRQALARGATMLACTGGTLAILFAFGGGEYWTAVTQSTAARINSHDPISAVLIASWHLTAVVLVLGAAGALLCLTDKAGWADRTLIWLAAIAALLVPLSQARIHTMTSLDKHVAFGAWFAAIAAGYAVDRLIRFAHWRSLRYAATAACLIMLVAPARIGATQAKALFESWPDAAHLIATLSYLLPRTSGPILAEHPSLPEYYLPQGTQWDRWSSTHSIRLIGGHSINPANGSTVTAGTYLDLIRKGYFSLIILDFGPTASLDGRITSALAANYHYHLAAAVPYGSRGATVWIYQPQRHLPPGALVPAAPAVPFVEGLLTPAAHPSPVLGPIFSAVSITGITTLALTIAIRFTWRRRKAPDEV